MVNRNGSHQQNFGAVFTRRWVAESILDLIGFEPTRDLAALHLLEPACGAGAFLEPIVERLIESANTHGRALESLGDSLANAEVIKSAAIKYRYCGEFLHPPS